MADFRQLHTRTWADTWFCNLKPEYKLFFIYLFSNERASAVGLYELPIRNMSFETGLDREVIQKGLEVFIKADKVLYDFDTSLVWVKNMHKYQTNSSSKLMARIAADIKAAPSCSLKENAIAWFRENTNLLHPRYGIDRVSIPNPQRDDETETETERDTETETETEQKTDAASSFENPFTVYENNIGAMTEIIAEKIKLAEKDYPPAWIPEAIKLAVVRNKRNWGYVEGILSRWKTEGKDNGKPKTGKKQEELIPVETELMRRQRLGLVGVGNGAKKT